MNLDLNNICDDENIYKSYLVANKKINHETYKNIACYISGGSDSDYLVDIFARLDKDKKVRYVFYDTGLEYDATKEHIRYLENKYNIHIHVEKPIKAIPTCCAKYGQPFLSKQVSEWIYRLQKHNFDWVDGSYESLISLYPNCKAALKWWCNEWDKRKDGQESSYNIAYNRYLKEFMIANPPKFKISNLCCKYAKKKVGENYNLKNEIDLSVTGVRHSERGARSTAYKNCFTSNDVSFDEYRPIFYYKDDTKQIYSNYYKIKHSECYTKYGLKRTGCAGCPFGCDFEYELDVIKKYEPRLYKSINNIFGDSYSYTREYYSFRSKIKLLSKKH